MNRVLRSPGLTILALLLLAASPLVAAPQQAPAPPAAPVLPAPLLAADLPDVDGDEGDVDFHDGDVDIHDGDVQIHDGEIEVHGGDPDDDGDVEMNGGDGDVEIHEHGPAAVTIVRGSRSYIGVRLLDLTPDLRELYTGSRDSGVLVSAVEAGSPAAKAGVKVGDVVTMVDGTIVSRPSEIARAVRRKEADQKVSLEVRRDKGQTKIEIAVAERKGSRREIRMHGFGGPGFSFPSGDWEERISQRVEEALERTREELRRIEERLKELEIRWQSK